LNNAKEQKTKTKPFMKFVVLCQSV